ncbi:Methyl-accepting chemotaxis protein [Desulfovibrio sp. DV]|uniref:bacteriohemerythrin n=1 Tax=Desulfovibrio sp. DV TaxID=1844708 RepID=UPI00094B8334|nr:bacteriohemerythrin [Desulfovibrio sp. DV]OLN31264.1 Methyl-accepting chemotaxis protein [Desulfovibrio sp. DV]
MIAWDESLAVGVDEIDAQHQSIIALINDLATRKNQADEATTTQALHFLRNYLHDHFELETELMLDMGYPDLEAHRQQHELFVNHIIFFEIEKEFGVVSEQMLADILAFLKDWFLSHIQREDKALGRFVRTQALSG